MTTMGDLISQLFATYEREYHDDELAAVATQVTLAELLRARGAKRARLAAPRKDA
ncbi:MAG TPA: hypothetical protein VLX92_07700 [Kofleriaceae bacterium]|nr:hypothetical protein [Kofleriaceae bacterium]